MNGQEPTTDKGGASKAYAVFSNDRGTKAQRLELPGVMEIIQNQSIADSLSLTGIVWDHNGRGVYSPMDDPMPDIVGHSLPSYREQEELVGKVLTIIDGLTVSTTQAKSLKFLLKREIYQSFREWETSVKQTYAGCKYRDENRASGNAGSDDVVEQ